MRYGLTTIGPEIRALREKRGIALETLALHADVHANVLRHYESLDAVRADEIGRLPSEAEIDRIAKRLRTTRRALMKRAAKRRPRASIVTNGGVMTFEEYLASLSDTSAR